MNRRRVCIGGCIVATLVAIGIPLQQHIRQLQRNSDLLTAIQQDRPERVKALLAQGADPNTIGSPHTPSAAWRLLVDRLLGKSRTSDGSASALGVAIGMSLSGEFDPNFVPWDPVVISTLLAHGAILKPTDPQHPWGDLQGWTLDNSGYGMAYTQHFNLAPGGNASPVGTGHVGFEKYRGIAIISAFRKAGLKEKVGSP